MTITKEYRGRAIPESEYFQPEERRVAGISKNHVWLYTVERGTEPTHDPSKPSKKKVVRIVRWQARNGHNTEEKYWRYRSSYSIRSSEEWDIISSLVDNLIEVETQTDSFISIPIEEYESLYRDSIRHKTEKQRLFVMIRDLKNTFEIERKIFKQKIEVVPENWTGC
jgi:hypothetical protein